MRLCILDNKFLVSREVDFSAKFSSGMTRLGCSMFGHLHYVQEHLHQLVGLFCLVGSVPAWQTRQLISEVVIDLSKDADQQGA